MTTSPGDTEMSEGGNMVERVAFLEEGQQGQYLKLIAFGPVDESMIEALEDFLRHQRFRLSKPPRPEPDPNFMAALRRGEHLNDQFLADATKDEAALTPPDAL